MRYLFCGKISPSRVSALEWRVGAVALAALVSSQGCGIMADAPGHALPTKLIAPSQTEPGKLSSDKPTEPQRRREPPPAASLPPPPETEPAPPTATIPKPSTVTETGLASWYGGKHHGKLTASGEIFNQNHLTAAHPTLAWGTRVKVVNLDNGKSVDVRINDRGPFKRGRIIDVSRSAARALGMVRRGLATVRIEWLADPETTDQFASKNQ